MQKIMTEAEEAKGRLAANIAKKIRMMIAEEKLKPGDRLPTESMLMELFDVSRTTVREAMKSLRAENVVDILQGRGTFVSSSTGITDDPLGLTFANRHNLLESLLETRLLFEPQVVMLAAMRATDGEIQKLRDCVEQLKCLEKNCDEATALDIAFHKGIAECTHNDVLIRVVPIINESIVKGYQDTVDNLESFRESKLAHERILQSIVQRDVMEARFHMENHIRRTMRDAAKT